jgi:hypothetical protein
MANEEQLAIDPTPSLPKYDMETIYTHREYCCRIWGGCPIGRVG